MKFMAPPGATSISFEQDAYPVTDGVVDCPQSVAATLGLTPMADAKAAKVAKPAGGNKGSDESIVDLNVEKAKALIAGVKTVEALAVIAEAEAANEKGARKGVVEAIDAKHAELTAAAK
jgi:hypothetical protein